MLKNMIKRYTYKVKFKYLLMGQQPPLQLQLDAEVWLMNRDKYKSTKL